jgi:O-6-methylguanine DNA methyltransferase
MLVTIPYGRSTTYGKPAAQLGLAREHTQALGAAIGANPPPLVRPCHRVIGAGGGMRGYVGGVDRKVWILTHEAFCGQCRAEARVLIRPAMRPPGRGAGGRRPAKPWRGTDR